MKIYIYGYNGNMAKRYRAILHELGHTVGGIDIEDQEYGFAHEDADAYIVATPTAGHIDDLYALEFCGRPILCEKPITKDIEELEVLLEDFKKSGTKLQMVSQYDYLIDDISTGHTVYNYFKSGGDGLAWDCINIIKHAKGIISIRNNSPIWTCKINGQKLNISQMDAAYIEMIADWLGNPDRTDFNGILRAHKKAAELDNLWKTSL
jgi:hypothetical protein